MTAPEQPANETTAPVPKNKGMAQLDLASETTVLSIPQGWMPDSQIRNEHSKVLFTVVKKLDHPSIQICNHEKQPLAFVRRKPSPSALRTVNDTYEIFSYEQNCDGQLFHDKDFNDTPVYEFATLKQGLFWSNYWYHSLSDEMPLVSGPSQLVGHNRSFSWVAMCCSFALCCAKWHIHFVDPKQQKMLEIDQVRGEIHVEKGMDLVAAVCISYVFDQFTRHPLDCKEASRRSSREGE